MRLNVGLVGLGRLGKVYARDLSSRLANTRLTAVADVDAAVAAETAAAFDVPRWYADPRDSSPIPAWTRSSSPARRMRTRTS